jgi:DnaJ-class molecular chaperone
MHLEHVFHLFNRILLINILICQLMMVSNPYSSSLIAAADNGSEDLYTLLGVSRTASKQEIKKAFRNMARKFHPDKNKDKDAEQTFRNIARAYEILSDDQKRAMYDRHGESAFTHGDGGQPQEGPGFNFHEFFQNFDFFQQQHDPHEQGHHFHSGFNFQDLFHDDDAFGGNHFGSFESAFGGHFGDGFFQQESVTTSHSQTCRTTTRREGNTVITQTECH